MIFTDNYHHNNYFQRKASYIKKSTEVIATKYNGDIPKTVDELVRLSLCLPPSSLSLSLSLPPSYMCMHTQTNWGSFYTLTCTPRLLDFSPWHWSQDGSPHHGLCLGQGQWHSRGHPRPSHHPPAGLVPTRNHQRRGGQGHLGVVVSKVTKSVNFYNVIGSTFPWCATQLLYSCTLVSYSS